MKTTEEFKKCSKKEYLKECEYDIKNIGWSLGNYCPFNCKQCYSLSVRNKGANLTESMIDRIIEQIQKLNCKTINFGGNEPWFTNGNSESSLLPYIIKKCKSIGLDVGITTSGISLILIEKYEPSLFDSIDDIDISLDSPIAEEHNRNRGANLFETAIKALELCQKYKIPHSIVMCSMNWNFTIDRLKLLIGLCKKYDANIRFNFLKPVKKEHIDLIVPAKQFYDSMAYVLNNCAPIDATEPRLSLLNRDNLLKRCPCGRTSLRIHSITPEGIIPVSPCVYLHDFKVGNLLEDDIIEIINSEPFKEFRRRNYNPTEIDDCKDCKYLYECGGGCSSAAYLYNKYKNNDLDFYKKEPNCFRDLDENLKIKNIEIKSLEKNLVHMDYLCTFIGKVL